MKLEELIKRLRVVGVSAVALLFILHFGLTLAYVAPPNPIKTKTIVPNLYVGTLFPQEWAFFAPDPVTGDIGVSVSCVSEAEGVQTPYMDIISPLWEKHRRNRLTPYDRISRIPNSWAIGLFSLGDEDRAILNTCYEGEELKDTEQCKTLSTAYDDQQKQAESALVRVATSYCRDLTSSVTFDNVEVSVWEEGILKWSQRNSGEEASIALLHETGRHPISSAKGFGIWHGQAELFPITTEIQND